MFDALGRVRLMLWCYDADPQEMWSCNACSDFDAYASAAHAPVVGAAEAGLRALERTATASADAIESKIAAYVAPTEGGAP